MHVLIILSNKDPEIQWNAIRFGNYLLSQGEEVSVFLNGPAVDLDKGDPRAVNIAEQVKLFTTSDGLLAA